MRSNYRKIGDFIKQSKLKNEDGRINLLLGVNLDKKFMPSVANLNGVDLTKYKVIKKGQFGCKLMSVGRDKKVPISRLTSFEEAIISSAYFVFEVKDENELNPEYLMMWFSRSESDRFQWFQSGADIRGRITWEEFCSLPIKVPSIAKQREIVKEYNTIVNRIKLNEQLNQKLEETAQALYKHWFVDFEFPNENRQPYKSSGGEMVYNEELDMEIPKGWKNSKLLEITEKIFSGGTPSTNEDSYWGEEYYWISSGETREKVIIDSERMITQKGVNNSSTKLAKIGDTIMASAGQGKTRGQTSFCKVDAYFNQSVLCIRPLNVYHRSFIYFNLKSRYYELRNESDAQSIRGSLNKDNLSELSILQPLKENFESFENIGEVILNKIFINRLLSKKLRFLKSLILSKMSKVESFKTEQV